MQDMYKKQQHSILSAVRLTAPTSGSSDSYQTTYAEAGLLKNHEL